VDDRGRIPGEEYTVALAVDYILPRRPSPVVVNLSTSTLVDACASRHGVSVSRAPVGEVHVVEQMEAEGALTGGEGNGGVIDRGFHAGRDSAVAMACVISLLRERECRLSEWVDGLPPLYMVKLKYPLSRPFEEIADFLAGTLGPPVDVRDGVRHEKPGGWAHLRPSGTEPVVRFIAQDSDPAELDGLVTALAGIAGEPCAE
jgi:phosphomannomutase